MAPLSSFLSATAQLPAALPPLGKTAHLGDARPFLASYIAGETVTQPFLAAVILLRLFTQHYISNGVVLEDFIMLFAYLFHWATVAVGLFCMESGSGAHMWDLTVGEYSDLFKYLFFYSTFYNAVSMCIKTAILLQYLRILVPYRYNKPAWLACWICIIVNVMFYITVIIMQCFQCKPAQSLWNPTTVDHCIDLETIYRFSGLFNAVSDYIILALPIPIIFLLKMSLKRKLGTYILFAFTGILVCVSWTLRAYYTWHIFNSSDPSFYFWPVGLWSQFEMTSDFFVFCLPILPQFYYFAKRKFLKSSSPNEEAATVGVKAASPGRAPEVSELTSSSSSGGTGDLPRNTTWHYVSTAERDDKLSEKSDIDGSDHTDASSSEFSNADSPDHPGLPAKTFATELG